MVEKKSSIKTKVYETIKKDDCQYIYNFDDDKQLLDLIKDVEYVRTSESYPSSSSSVFFYNIYDAKSNELNWEYYLFDSGDYVRIYYYYMNRLNEQNHVEISYKIDSSKGKAIIKKAIELAKNNE